MITGVASAEDPSPELVPSTLEINVNQGDTFTVTFITNNTGGTPNDQGQSHITVSFEDGLDIVDNTSWSSRDKIYHINDSIWHKNGSKFPVKEEMLEAYSSFPSGTSKEMRVTFRAISEGDFLIKARFTLVDFTEDENWNTANYYRDPAPGESSEIDQQGYEVITIRVHVEKFTNLIFQDDFNNLDTDIWIPFGSPSPRILTSFEKRIGVFDNNGDSWCPSGVVNRDAISLTPPFTIESDMYLDLWSKSGCWAAPSFELYESNSYQTSGYCANDVRGVGSILRISLDYVGDACWASPQEKRRHAYLQLGYLTENGEWDSGPSKNYGLLRDDLVDGWHNYKVKVDSEGYVSFYVDNELIYKSEDKIDVTKLKNCYLWIGRRSSGSAGKAYHDYIRVYKGQLQYTQPSPIASFTYSPSYPFVDQEITFDASNSTDPDGTIEKYEWNFGDGNTATGIIVTYSYSSAGSYDVTLTVTDDDGATDEETKSISISPKIVYVDDDFVDDPANHKWDTIQEGVDDAIEGCEIVVYDGVYTENIKVNKPHLTIRSENGSDSTIVQAKESSDHVFEVTADCVNISGFKITSAIMSAALHLLHADHCVIFNNNLSNNVFWGIYLNSSNNNGIYNNVLSNNLGSSIWLNASNNNMISNNNMNNNHGLQDLPGGGPVLYLDSSSNNTINNNDISNNTNGVYLSNSSMNNINNNIISNNWSGLYLDFSSENKIVKNTFINDYLFVNESYQNTVEDNTINGKLLVYLEDESDRTITDEGQIILVNCNNVTVENLNLFNIGTVELWKTNNSKIKNNNISSNERWWGICLYYSSNNTISKNSILSNGAGILIDCSSSNNISNNNISSNCAYGIRLKNSSYNKVSNNNISDNHHCDLVGGSVNLRYSDNNIISNNNIFDDAVGIWLMHSNDDDQS